MTRRSYGYSDYTGEVSPALFSIYDMLGRMKMGRAPLKLAV